MKQLYNTGDVDPIASTEPSCFLLVDGLDELIHRERPDLLDFLKEVLNLRLSNLHVSRFRQQIHHMLVKMGQFNLLRLTRQTPWEI